MRDELALSDHMMVKFENGHKNKRNWFLKFKESRLGWIHKLPVREPESLSTGNNKIETLNKAEKINVGTKKAYDNNFLKVLRKKTFVLQNKQQTI